MMLNSKSSFLSSFTLAVPLTSALALVTCLPALGQAPRIVPQQPVSSVDQPSVEEWLERAHAALEQQEFVEAARLFSIAQAFAGESKNEAASKVIPFYVALSHQLQADRVENKTQAKNLREHAMMVYAGVLKSFPNSAAVYNNLALLHKALGNQAIAEQMASYVNQLAHPEDPNAKAYSCLRFHINSTKTPPPEGASAMPFGVPGRACQTRLSREPTWPAPSLTETDATPAEGSKAEDHDAPSTPKSKTDSVS